MQLDVEAVQPRNLLKPATWLSKIDFINHLILFNNVIISVLAEKNGGKTSFATLLQQQLDQQIKSLCLTIKTPCDRELLIAEIASQLHLKHDSQTDIDSLMMQINERKAHVLLILDEAQHIPESLLKEMMVAVKKQGEFGFFHVCLLSDYSLVATLNILAINQLNNLIHNIELGHLTENEARTYILQRAMTARLINRPLTDLQFRQYYHTTKGHLAKINNSMEAYITQCLTQKSAMPAVSIKKASVAISAVVLAGFAYIYVENFFTSSHISDEMRSPLTYQFKNSKEHGKTTPELISYVPSLDDSVKELLQAQVTVGQNLDQLAQQENNQALTNGQPVSTQAAILPSQHQPAPDDSKKLAVEDQSLQSSLVAIELSQKNSSVQSTANSGSRQFTIQLAASHNMSDIHRFRSSHNLLSNTKVSHFTNQKGKWYVLTLGEFGNRSLAQEHINNLPNDLTKLKPWIRPVSGLTLVG